MAHSFDTENGAARRKQLQRRLQQTARTVDSVLTSEVGDPPPVFHPVWRGLRALEPDVAAPEPVEAAAPSRSRRRDSTALDSWWAVNSRAIRARRPG